MIPFVTLPDLANSHTFSKSREIFKYSLYNNDDDVVEAVFDLILKIQLGVYVYKTNNKNNKYYSEISTIDLDLILHVRKLRGSFKSSRIYMMPRYI